MIYGAEYVGRDAPSLVAILRGTNPKSTYSVQYEYDTLAEGRTQYGYNVIRPRAYPNIFKIWLNLGFPGLGPPGKTV
jgi:hypothetical protein